MATRTRPKEEMPEVSTTLDDDFCPAISTRGSVLLEANFALPSTRFTFCDRALPEAAYLSMRREVAQSVYWVVEKFKIQSDQASEIPALNPRADRSSTDDVHSLDVYLHGTPVQPVTCYESRVMCRECRVLDDGSINVS